jgi:hypothetical protein
VAWPKLLAEKMLESWKRLRFLAMCKFKGRKPSFRFPEEDFGTFLGFLFFSPLPPGKTSQTNSAIKILASGSQVWMYRKGTEEFCLWVTSGKMGFHRMGLPTLAGFH